MHFNNMLWRIRQTRPRKKLLSQIQQFNEELQGKFSRQANPRTAHYSCSVNEALVPEPAATRQWERMAGMVYQSAAIAHEIGTPHIPSRVISICCSPTAMYPTTPNAA
jgi:hypothetical protein